jgi:hypothetical protein
MFHQGTRTVGGNVDHQVSSKIQSLLDEFVAATAHEVEATRLRRAVVRSMLTCSLIVVLDAESLWIAAQKQTGMPSTIQLDHRDKKFPLREIYEAAKWEFGFDEPFVVQFPSSLLEQDTEIKANALFAIAKAHVQAELQRVHHEMNVIQINPIFGPASYVIDPRLAFVLMPFTDELTAIYQTFIKPTVESPEFGLVCKRADDIKSNRAIIQDIWKSVCEAQLIIADLTGLNANVMYELGIAHILGKETILIYQKGGDIRFPFDLTHIRRIEYENNAMGGRKLEQELKATLSHVLTPTLRA